MEYEFKDGDQFCIKFFSYYNGFGIVDVLTDNLVADPKHKTHVYITKDIETAFHYCIQLSDRKATPVAMRDSSLGKLHAIDNARSRKTHERSKVINAKAASFIHCDTCGKFHKPTYQHT